MKLRFEWIVVAALTLVLLSSVALGVASRSPDYVIAGCSPADHGGQSVARVWNETLLDAIRRDVPAPTVHARNLFHLSAAMWDAWTAYDPDSRGYFVDEQHTAADIDQARHAAISFAAYRLLLSRYQHAAGLGETFAQLEEKMEDLCYRTDYVEVGGDSPAVLGNRIAAAIIAAGADDGSLESDRYIDASYRPVNDPLVVANPGTTMRDPNRWQPLALAEQVAQNDLPIPGQVQRYIGPNWGFVDGFALEASPTGLPLDPGPPPRLDDDAGSFQDEAVRVLESTAALDPLSPDVIDIGPGAWGNNPLGTNDGSGHPINPVTGEPYAPNPVPAADFGRVIAEFWADGPDSETPPGHWNTIANHVAGTAGFERRWQGEGPVLDDLEWDVKTYFALNGALHDAAVAAWGAKAFYDSARPISMIRYLGGNGQSTDPDGDSFHPQGLPFVPGLVEAVTEESSAPGERHEHLADHIGEVVVRSWRGAPADPSSEVSGVGWIRAVQWVPYQRPDFVSPAFAGYVSGHSTFSRAAAEILSVATGSRFFPGGMTSWTVAVGGLQHEFGPTQDVTLQWATYADAADQAGLSRLYGGIHIPADDFAGRRMGAEIGAAAWERARQYLEGGAG